MMDTLREVFDPNFLLRNSVYISVLIGVTCPLIGVYLVLRRHIFLGVALPQVSSCGIAFAFGLHAWGLLPHAEGSSEHNLAFLGAGAFTIIAIFALAFLERRGRGVVEGRIGTLYALAGAWSILLLVKNPYGEHGLLDRLRGEIISISDFDLVTTGVVFSLVVAVLLLFRKEFLLVSFDRQMAVTLKKKVLVWDSLLFFLTGVTVSMAVLSVGPLVTFGFLVIPPLVSNVFAANMRQFSWFAALIGLVTALAGFCLAYRYDYPVGPTDVALGGVFYLIAYCFRMGWTRLHRAG
jgi:ABC-type Mn2+/Zn2+ transport system permease subunit